MFDDHENAKKHRADAKTHFSGQRPDYRELIAERGTFISIAVANANMIRESKQWR